MPFDTLKDLAPVMLIGKGSMVLTAHVEHAVQDVCNEMLLVARSQKPVRDQLRHPSAPAASRTSP